MAQNHQIRMSLMFDADTSQAKASLKELQASLNNLTSGVARGEFPMTSRLKEAYTTAEQLKTILNSSINMSTGQFDLSKFNSQLKSAGLSATSLGQKFAGAGATGAQVFTQLSSAIAHAEIPTKRVSHLFENMARSLKSTMQWQISSSAIHGITGAMSQAYGYAQDLNKSLNDIRIVTGENIEFMERYATAANKAARALSSTTNEYAKASLIFYQQGLDDAEVAKRTEATIKMANVTGESAQEISSYMTAIWNNFDNGTKSLEYYADAITALGAATASSTEEIAGGMQKFASVAETVGLSYEYAASALATVVAATRQSEETVGTSFKTIFARLSSLSLGETLEDGTNLTKYTAALAKVGISVKDSEGALKSMDQILDELGTKWGSISREQQTALAYTVAGTRQYNNFISLLDNYKDFKINVDLAIDSEGTLNKQQEIYSESWEAAANRAKAAAESIYEKLLDDDFFIDFLDGLEKFLNGFDKFIDAMGGLPGILSLVSSLMLRIFSAQTTEAVRNLGYGIKSITGVAAAEAGQTKATYMAEARNTLAASRIDIGRDTVLQTEVAMLEKKIGLEQTYLSLEGQLSDEGKRQYQAQSALLGILEAQAREKAKQLETATSGLSDASRNLMQEDSYREATDDVFGKKAAVLAERDKAEERRTQANVNLTEAKIEREKKQAQLAQAEAEFQATADTYVKDTLSQAGGHTSAGVVETNGKYQLSEPPKMKDSSKQSLVDEAYTPVEEAAAKIEKLKKEIAELGDTATQAQAEIDAADMQYTEADQKASKIKAMGQSDAKIELDKYSNYTTGQAQGQVRELGSIIGDYKAIQAKGVNDPNYQQSIEQLRSHLDQFQADYEQELGAETNKIIKTIMQELNKQDPKDIKLDTKALGKELSTAHAKDSQKYKKADAYEIREAMKNEAGIEFTDEKAFSSYAEGLEKTTKATKEANKSQEEYNSTIQQTGDKMQENVQKKLPDAATSFTNLSSGIASASTALMTFKGVFDVWSNSDMSFGEKLLSTFTSLGFAIPAVVSAISMFQQVNLKAMGTSIKDTVATWANVLAHKASEKARRQEALATDKNARSTDKLTKKTNKNTISEIFSKGKQGLKNTGTKIKTGFKDFGSGFKMGVKGAAKGASGAATGGTASLASSLGTIASAALPIAAGIALIAGAIAISVSLYNKEAKAAQKAKQEMAKFAEEAKEAKSNYDNTVNTVASYTEALDGMKTLTKGTKEWNEALLEVNNQAFELIGKFDTLAGKYHFEDGQVVFDEGALEDLQEEQLRAAEQAQANSMAASNVAKKAENASTTTNLARKLQSDGDIGKDIGNAVVAGLVGAGAGALIGAGATSWSGPGAAIGAGIGAAAGLITGVVTGVMDLTSTDAERDAIDRLAEIYDARQAEFKDDEAFELLLRNELKLDDEGLINSLLKNRDMVQKSIAEMSVNTAAINAQTEALINKNNQGNDAYANSWWQDLLTKEGRKQALDTNSKAYKDAEKKVDEMFKGDNLKEGGIWDQYLELRYGEEADKYKAKLGTWFDGAVSIKKENEDGTWEDAGEIDEATMKAWMVEYYASILSPEMIKETTYQASKTAGELSRLGITDDQVLRDLTTQYEEKGVLDLSQYTGEQLKELATKVNKITDDSLRKATKDALAAAETSWVGLLSDFSDHTKTAITTLEQEAMKLGIIFSRDSAASYGAFLEKLTQITGNDQAARMFQTKVNQLIEANPQHKADILEAIGTISWEDPLDGAQNFDAKMKAIGLEVDMTSWTLNDMGDTIASIDFSNSLNQLQSMQTYVTTIKDLFEKISTIGQTITKEEFERLKTEGILDESNVIADPTGETYTIIKAPSFQNENASADKDKLILSEVEKAYADNQKEIEKYENETSTAGWFIKSGSDLSNYENQRSFYLSARDNPEVLKALAEKNGKTEEEMKAWITKYYEDTYDINGESGTLAYFDSILATDLTSQYGSSGDLTKRAKQEQGWNQWKPYEKVNRGFNEQDRIDFIGMVGAGVDLVQSGSISAKDAIASIQDNMMRLENEGKLNDDARNYAEEVITELEKYANAQTIFGEGAAARLTWQNIDSVKALAADEKSNYASAKEEEATLIENMFSAATSLQELERIANQYNLTDHAIYQTKKEWYETQIAQAQEDLLFIDDIAAQMEKLAAKREDQKVRTDLAAKRGDRVSLLTGLEAEDRLLEKSLIKNTTQQENTKRNLNKQAQNIATNLGITSDQWQGIYKEYGENGEITNWDSILSQLYEIDSRFAMNEDFQKTFDAVKANYQKASEQYITALNEEEKLREQQVEQMVRRGELLQQTYKLIQEEIQHTVSELNHVESIINSIGAENLGLNKEELQQLNNTQNLAATASAGVAAQTYQDAVNHLAYLKDQLATNENLTREQRTKLQQAIADQETVVRTSLEDMNNNWSEALNQAAQTFQDNVTLTLQDFEASISGVAGSLEAMEKTFSQQSEISEQYLSDYEKVYHLNKLSRDLQKSIDETNSIQGKQALNELQQELIDMQAEGAQVSQYDLEYMQKKYDLRLAEIALEEAQNAKSQVRLQKMANGSWGYVYTQNEAEVEKAQATYEEKLFNLQDYNTEYLNSISEQIITTQKDFTAAIQEIYSSGLSEEEQAKRIEEVTAFYESKLGYLTSEMDTVLANNEGLQGMVTEFSDTLLGAMYPEGYDEADDIFTTWKEKVADPKNGLLTELNTLANSYKDNIETIFGALGISIDTWLDTMLDDTRTAAREMSAIVEKARLGEAFAEDLGITGTRATTIDTILKGQKEKGITLWDEEGLNALDNTALQRTYNQAAAMGMIDNVSLHGWYSDQAGFTRDEMIEMLKAVAPSGYLDMYGDLSKLSDDSLKTLMRQAMGFGWLSSDVMERLMQGDWAAFASGGYTGEWGPEGRLAMLHEKELVLNADDTQNLLHTMKVMDQLIKNIELQALSAALDSALAVPSIRSSGETLQQEVTIHAEFPNATNHSEIEQAFDTLINRASQYANRNR